MNGMIVPSVSAGSSQRAARLTCTPHVIVSAGVAARAPETPGRGASVATTARARARRLVTSRRGAVGAAMSGLLVEAGGVVPQELAPRVRPRRGPLQDIVDRVGEL